MASNGIRDRVAIVGMGCTSFGERWDKSVSDLLVDATKDATASAGIDLKDIDAFWLGTLFSGQSGLTLSRPLKIDYKDRKSTRLNSSHQIISYAVFCLKKKIK